MTDQVINQKTAIDVSIVVPTYNELNNINELIKRIHQSCVERNLNEEIIIVDDNSPDGTANYARELSGSFPIKVVQRKGKLGLSSAIMSGFGVAKSEIVGVIDADLSHPPEIVPHLVDLIQYGGRDLVLGSRYIKLGGVEQWTLIRKTISRGATYLARPLTKVKDPMSGFFFMKKGIIDGIELKSKGYKILLEILVKAKYNTVAEYPYTFLNREVGSSKMGSKTMVHYVQQLYDLYKYKMFK